MFPVAANHACAFSITILIIRLETDPYCKVIVLIDWSDSSEELYFWEKKSKMGRFQLNQKVNNWNHGFPSSITKYLGWPSSNLPSTWKNIMKLIRQCRSHSILAQLYDAKEGALKHYNIPGAKFIVCTPPPRNSNQTATA